MSVDPRMRAIVSGAIAGAAAMLALAPCAGAASNAAPTCTPARLNNSALIGGAVTVSPVPGSRDASPQTQISFRGVPAGQLRVVSVVGSRTGAHRGRMLAYSQGDGASYVPSQPFAEGERVSVRARLQRGSRAVALADQFVVAERDPLTATPEAVHPGPARDLQAFHSRPDLHPPIVRVTAQSPAAAPGDEFLAPYSGPGQAGPMILDPNGGLIWFRGLSPTASAANLQVQEYQGRPVLTWWHGDISIHGFGVGQDVITDSTYTDIAKVNAGNGYQADLHEFQLTPQGTALITAFAPVMCDLSAVHGSAAGAATDGVLQEIDIKTGLVRFEWTSLDHAGLDESYEVASRASTEWPFDFFHINSIDLEPDTSLLVSARNTWAVYQVNGSSGQVMWRLGGRRSTFALAPGVATAWQHDPRLLANGSISIFDNGASPTVHHQSRGIVVGLDAAHRKATLLGQLIRPGPLLAQSQGNLQALPNGDWFIGWGQVPDMSEFNAAGQLLFDARLPGHAQSYRSFRFLWEATPAHPPAFVVAPGANGARTVYASWNGATRVAAWRALAGPAATSMSPVAQAARSGFETAIALPAGAAGPLLTVQALDSTGAVIGTANAHS